MSKLMEVVEPMARQLEYLDEQISRLNHEVDELKSQREEVNEKVIAVLQEQGVDRTMGLANGGTIKLYSSVYPSVKDLYAFEMWAKTNTVLLPAFSINAKTMQGWYSEQMENGKPLPPEEIVSVFTKVKAKVLKK